MEVQCWVVFAPARRLGKQRVVEKLVVGGMDSNTAVMIHGERKTRVVEVVDARAVQRLRAVDTATLVAGADATVSHPSDDCRKSNIVVVHPTLVSIPPRPFLVRLVVCKKVMDLVPRASWQQEKGDLSFWG